jgi:hypothetical protein
MCLKELQKLFTKHEKVFERPSKALDNLQMIFKSPLKGL